jgi:hypothetical protein
LEKYHASLENIIFSDLPAMRKQIRDLEDQASKANQLITHLSRRNQYLKQQHKDIYNHKHTEYSSAYLDWREESDNWFKLRDEIDKTNKDMKKEASDFLAKCQTIIDETADLDASFDKELSNLDIDYAEIVQFIKQEPVWLEEIEDLKCKPLYYQYLFTFQEAREEVSLALVGDLFQRKMQKDFMKMAYHEGRTMPRQLPSACKAILDERGLLAQETNQMRSWCNRLQRRHQNHILQQIQKKDKEKDILKPAIHHQVVRRQPLILQARLIKRRLRSRNLRWPKEKTSKLHMDTKSNRTREKLTKSEQTLEAESKTNRRQRAAAETVKRDIADLRGMVKQNYHQRQVNNQVVMKVAAALKKAFGIPDDFSKSHWSAKGALRDSPVSHPENMVAKLNNILAMAKESSAKALIAPVYISVARGSFFDNFPTSLQKLTTASTPC